MTLSAPLKNSDTPCQSKAAGLIERGEAFEKEAAEQA
jgi:hypothetical protein